MIYLPNGCARSEISVTPKNWNVKKPSDSTARALIKKKWRIYYRYYDPTCKGTKDWGYMVQIRDMNDVKDLAQRQELTRVFIENEKDKVDLQGYNPITEKYFVAPAADNLEEITPSTPFITALWSVSKMLNCGDMLNDIKSIIRGMDESAGKLFDKVTQKPYKALKIKDVTRKHIIYILQQRKKDNPKFSSYRYNKYRTALMMLYKALVAVEAVDSNLIKDIPIKTDWVHEKRELLTDAEQLIIDTNLKAWDYYYWRYMRIFHRSGSRTTEMAGLKTDKVNLEAQEFTLLVRKGKKWSWQIRPIPDDILPLWIEVMEETVPGDYLFGSCFKPGPVKMGKKTSSDRWKKYVKNPRGKFDPHGKGWGLGINKSFYGLKALNMDKIDEKEGIELAADAAGHGDTKMAKKHYLPGHEKRQREKLKKIGVDFAAKKDQQN